MANTIEMNQVEFESKKKELMGKYHKCSSSPTFGNPNRWKHDFYSRNGRRMLTVYENR